jgi:serine/threonine-protein kinase RsbW
MTRKSANVEVRLPSRLGYEKGAMSTAASVAKLMGFREDRIEDLKTAVAEACINAIEHGR